MITRSSVDLRGPLKTFLSMRRPMLDALAATWLAQDARWVALCDIDGDALTVWPAEDTLSPGEVVSAPLVAGGQAVGLWRVGVLFEDDANRERVRAEATLLSGLLGNEDELEDMTIELIESQDRLLALYRLNSSLRGQIDLDSIMTTMARNAVTLIGTRAALILLEDPGGWHINAYPEAEVNVAAILSAFQTCPVDQETLLHTDDGILYVMPISLTTGVSAGLVLVDKDGGFTSPDLKLARAIIDMAGVHLENARLHQESLRQAEINTQLSLAADIQRQLLPAELPAVPGLDLFGGSVQARSVGGDFYDAYYRDGGILTFMVGDVTGKGFSSALMMAVTRTALRSRAELKKDWAESGAVFTRANQDLYDDYSRVNMFTTAFLGRYDPETGLLCYSNAGHSPVIYCPAGGQARLMLAEDMPLGILPDMTYRESVMTLQPDDLLVVATDGFSEARNHNRQMFGYDALLDLITANAHRDAADLVQLLFETVREFSDGHPQDDDQTIFVLKQG